MDRNAVDRARAYKQGGVVSCTRVRGPAASRQEGDSRHVYVHTPGGSIDAPEMTIAVKYPTMLRLPSKPQQSFRDGSSTAFVGEPCLEVDTSELVAEWGEPPALFCGGGTSNTGDGVRIGGGEVVRLLGWLLLLLLLLLLPRFFLKLLLPYFFCSASACSNAFMYSTDRITSSKMT